MKFEQADEVTANTSIEADVCVVGSGAAGITIARQLNGTKLRVLVLEAGGLEQDPAAEAESFAIEHLGNPYGNPIPTRGRWFGGSTNLWFGRIAMPDPIDLEARPWVPHSGWPLTLGDLEPWIRKAVEILEVPHFDKISIQNWPDNLTIDTFIRRGGANLDVFLWADALYMGPRWRETLGASANVRVLLGATATELLPNPEETAIETLYVQGPRKNRFEVKAKAYVLAAGGLENPRLLLASQARSARGVGNGQDLVGRFYMDHPRGEGTARIDLRGLTPEQLERVSLLGEKSKSAYGKVQLRLTFPEQMQRDEALLNHSLHAHLVSDFHESEGFHSVRRLLTRLKQRSTADLAEVKRDVLNTLGDSAEIARFGVQKLLGTVRPTKLIVIDQMEQEPDPESRVTIDGSQRDRHGLPKLRLDWRIGASTYRSQRRMHKLFKDILERVGIRGLESDPLDRPDELPTLVEMKHPTGTTRMSVSEKQGVVDVDGRVHGLGNLYVTGSSVFPTVGHFNPTLIIVGLAARLADHLQRRVG